MKVVILAGGLGTRISEESHLKPKPMIEIGGRPILWHIMKIYSHYGFDDFVICLGYKGYVVKEYFAHYFLHESDVTFDFTVDGQPLTIYRRPKAERWRVTLVDTGQDTMTGGRLKRIAPYVSGGTFMMTYGDGVADIDLRDLLTFHRRHGKRATLTSVQPGGRFGSLSIDAGQKVRSFVEKPKGDGHWVSGGFFVLEPEALEEIEGDETTFEREPMERLARAGQLMAYKHTGYWQAMDTMRDKALLEEQWKTGQAPWKVWKG
ncbi:glucose-1-phosphate cytidylyltransferase [Paenibacillus thermoaerophilus]|uniref:Glucose-1-phosphate cytidylyltransferase n=1 Tax=Paenibacillus thermoaerophilus TaxID=1215385 RepID=A0ABW2V880_9BACL|nr:glucose-1-phosphate cytidylyltransferase [Paenibacillus thermoaerophilus]TMV07350.1 glucose-1-phosphate cytidylyltransferase [Paenibacillus thermoaerophilus]